VRKWVGSLALALFQILLWILTSWTLFAEWIVPVN